MAEFYEDAEKCFEKGAWLPFSLMCGGIFEGILLANKINERKFQKQIDIAKQNKIINGREEKIMNNVRNNRNIVHANNYGSNYVSRKEAMDIRSTLDLLIEKF